MAGLHLLPARLIRWTSLCVCFGLLFSAIAGIPFQTASSKESSRVRPQEQDGNERRVAPLPPRTGPPAANLPNLDEVKHRRVEAPRAAVAVPSMVRSRRKPLEPRNGRRVGDGLPPIPRPSPTPVATLSALPTPVATPRLDELARFESPLSYLGNDLVFRYLVHPFFSRGFLTPLSDSSSPLFASGNTSFDVTAAPIPQSGGSKIVFASSRDGFMQIYVMNSDGTGQVRLTTDGSNNENPRWSPNGTKILFQSDRDNPGSGLRDIYVMNSNGSGQTRLTTDPNDDCFASWSADGTKIVFQSLRNGVSYQIYTMNADGSGQVNISNNGVSDMQPSWSPDGTKIAFASERDQAGFPSVYVMNSNGTNQTRLTFSGTGLRDEQPVWSSNGSKIAFTSTRDSITDSWTETDDYEIPEDDGQTFPKSRFNINKEVYLMNPDGSGQTRLTNDLSNDDSPTWSPDGTKIVFRSERERDLFDPSPQLWTMNADGSGQTNLSNSGDSDFSPSWTSGSANQAPIANAGGPYSGVVGQNAPFSGNGSFDPDGSIVSYAWTFGDGGTGSGVAPTHAYGAAGTFTVMLTVTDNLGAQGTASTTISVSASSSDQFVGNFLQWGLGRAPSGQESSYWTDIVRAAYPQGQPTMMLAMREFGMTIFESAEYGSRNRSDQDFVYDCYKTYLMREPDQGGWDYWTSVVPLVGRDNVRRAFDECSEFAAIVSNLTASGAPSASASSLATAQVDPFNQSGNQLQARDAEWSANLLSLPGRASLDLGLNVSYSSLVFTRSGPYLYFDQDYAALSPGFIIGFPTIQFRKFDAQTSRNVYILNAAGRRVALRQVATSNVYESADSSYLQLIDYGSSLLLRTTDGTQISFAAYANNWGVTTIKDRNGNFINVANDWRGDIQNVTDTPGRVITFNYDPNANLNSITQTWNGQTHTWATFGWDSLTMQPTLSGIVGTYSGETIPVLKMVGFHDATYTKFLYNGNGQVTRVTQYASDSNPATDNHPRSYTQFDYDSATNDCPRLTATRTWAEYWTGLNGVPTEVTTQFGVEGDKHTVTVLGDPNGTVYKESYAGSSSPAWQRGLVLQSEVWSAGVQQKLTTVAWTQENTSVVFKTNPRVIETNVYDSVGNRRRVTIDYSVPWYTQFGLPYAVREYAADATTVLRETVTDYKLDQPYIDRRMIGLVSQVHLVSNGYQAKVTYGYDDPARLSSQAVTATMHDQSYDVYFTIRGNLTSVSRWDVTDINNATKALTTYMNYNAAGSVVSTTDPAGHANSISYSDSFSDGNNSRNTFAYPTAITDADNFSSTIQYNFDLGAKTRVEGPPPQNQPNGVIQTFLYDDAARLQRVTTVNNGAYTRYVYGSYWVQSFSTVNTVADEAYSITTFDGVGRAFTTTTNHPGSAGGYKLVNVIFDRMGRPFLQSNPTEVNSSWLPAGDDAAGVRYSLLTFDWNGRTLRTTHPDGTYKDASYSVCGCAGSEVTTLTDEVGRRQKVYSDVLGRRWKNEILNWDGSIYSTTTNTFNARDQVTLIRQYAGTEQSTTYQDTVMAFDGYGRLQSRHVPEQSAGTATTWAYNADGTVKSVSDSRGSAAIYSYNNNRHLVSHITYEPGTNVPDTPDVAFEYDATGNRTSMSDSLGTVTFNRDSLSRLTSETRTFNGLGSFTLSYDYNLAGQLKRITNATGGTINYGFDSAGRLSGVTGGDNLYAGVSNYASNFQYRAWNGLKSRTDGTGRTSSILYNLKLHPSQFNISGNVVHQTYDYYNDGHMRFVYNSTDPNFDRAYSFDHVGRLISATSGGVARNDFGDTPYSETFGYDAFANMTARSAESWNGQTSDFDSGTYVNNRRTGWGYDSDGRITTIDTRTYSFDAVGRMKTMTGQRILPNGNHVPVTHSGEYDGDGRKLKDVVNGVTTYYLVSSVLGGRIVEELNSSGQKLVGYVYSPDGTELACQANNAVTWKHNTPVGTGRYETYSNNNYVNRIEFDPVGANVSLVAPPEPPPTEGEGDLGNMGGIMSERWASFFNLAGGCTSLGFSAACSQIASPQQYLDQQTRAFFGHRWYDLPGNNNEAARAEARYASIYLPALSGQLGFDPEFNRVIGTVIVTMQFGSTQFSFSVKNPTLDQYQQLQTAYASYSAPQYATAYEADTGTSDQDEHDVSSPYNVTIFGGAAYFTQETYPGAMGNVKIVNTGGDSALERNADQVRGRIMKMALSKNCNDAFKRAGRPTPDQLVQKGIILASRRALTNPAYNSALGITEAIRVEANKSDAPLQTIRPQFTSSGKPVIIFDATAFQNNFLDEGMPHELIHGGGVGQVWGFWGVFSHDLKGYGPYEEIIANCK